MWSEAPNSFSPRAEGRLAYCRGARESPGSVSLATLKNLPDEEEGGTGDYHCEVKRSEVRRLS